MDCEIVDGKLRVWSLEFFVADTCNLRCEGCAAASPFLRNPNWPELEQMSQTLSLLAPVMTAQQLKILGGEPLLNKKLMDYVSVARRSGMFDKIRITTNGLLLDQMSDAFWNEVDVVEISKYPNLPKSLEPRKLAEFAARADRFGVNLIVKDVSEFNACIVDEPIQDRELVQHIYESCAEVQDWPCHAIYRGRLYRCSRVHTIDQYLTGIGCVHESFTERDGLPIDSSEGLLARVKAYLESSEPLNACNYCLGTAGTVLGTHRQLSVAEIRAKREGRDRVPFKPELLSGALRFRLRQDENVELSVARNEAAPAMVIRKASEIKTVPLSALKTRRTKPEAFVDLVHWIIARKGQTFTLSQACSEVPFVNRYTALIVVEQLLAHQALIEVR